MNYPLDFAITKVCTDIPPQILELTINHANKRHKENNNLTEFIINKIINFRVLKDCNLTAGQVKTIALQSSWIEQMPSDHGAYAGDDGPYTIYRIPPEARDNKSISQVMTVQFPYLTYQASGIASADVYSGGYSLADQIEQVINSHTLATPRNHPLVTLLSGDLVKLTPTQYSRQNWLLTCRINYDETFNNLHDAAIPILTKLVMLATKQWIYTNLIIDIDRAVMETGADIGTIRSIIESYSDAGQQYDETFVQWCGSSSMDPEYRRRMMFLQL